jgi:hypothetical protein
MADTVTTSAATSGVAAGRPQPQTTIEPAGGPFVRHTQPGRRAMYLAANAAFGGVVANPMVASPGYNRGYRVKVQAVTGAGTGGVIAATAGGQDAPYSLAQLVQVKDAFGTPLMTGPGYDILKLVPEFSGQFGTDETTDIQNLPSWTGITAASGAFTFASYLPFEFAKAYGVVSGANASLLPTLQFNLATAATLFSTPPSVLPTLNLQVDADFYWLPEGVAVEPPGIGTTCQWVYQPCNPVIPTGGSVIVQLPRLGGYLTCIILDLRDSLGARVDGFPARPRIYIDGVPLIDSDLNTVLDDMAIGMQVGGGTAGGQTTAATPQTPRPTGVLAFTRKTGLAQRHFGLFDTGEEFLSTNPGTQVEISGMPWGTIANSPATLNVIVGQVVPSGALIQGLPEV